MKSNTSEKINILDILVLIFSFLFIIVLSVELLFKVDEEVLKLLNIFECVGCIVFITDILCRFKKSDNKLSFLCYNSIDIIASIPFFHGLNYLNYAKGLRIIKLFKIIKIFRSANILRKYIKNNRSYSMGTMFIILLVLLVVVGSISILTVEQGTETANIKTAEDALWWSYITITTVGYGDFYPVTSLGRVVAVLVSLGGIGLYGTFTGFIATYFIGEKENE